MQHTGDLETAENACAELEIKEDGDLTLLSPTYSTSKRRQKDANADMLKSLKKRIEQSGNILKDIARTHQQPYTSRTAFADYARDSTVTMSKPKYKRARSNINRLLPGLMEFSDEDVSTTTVSAVSTAPVMQ